MRSKHFISDKLRPSLEKHFPGTDFKGLNRSSYVHMGHHSAQFLNLLESDLPIEHQHHYIEMGSNSAFLKRFQEGNFAKFHMAHDLTEAVAFALNLIDVAHIYPDDILCNDQSIELMFKGELLLKIGKIKITSVNKTLDKELSQAFKGIKAYGDEDKLYHRLKKINGLENLIDEQEGLFDAEDLDQTWKKYSRFNTIENLGVFLKQLINAEGGIDVKTSLALEIVAEAFGRTDWNRFKVMAEKHELSINHPVSIAYFDDNKWEIEFYRNNNDAITALIDFIKKRELHLNKNVSLTLNTEYELFNSINLEVKFVKSGVPIARLCTPNIVDYMFDEYFEIKELKIDSLAYAVDVIKNQTKFDGKFIDKIKSSNKTLDQRSHVIDDILITVDYDYENVRIQKLNEERNGIELLEGLFGSGGYIEGDLGELYFFKDKNSSTAYVRFREEVQIELQHLSLKDLRFAAKLCESKLQSQDLAITEEIIFSE